MKKAVLSFIFLVGLSSALIAGEKSGCVLAQKGDFSIKIENKLKKYSYAKYYDGVIIEQSGKCKYQNYQSNSKSFC